MNRLQRLLLLLGSTLLGYFVLMQPIVLSSILPQIQIFFVGVLVITISATVGAMIGMVLFPYKVDWGNEKDLFKPATIARVLIILCFIYFGVTYA